MKKLICLLFFTGYWLLVTVHCNATPSTQIWNPSTDIQGVKTFHLGIDDYFSVSNNDTKPYQFATDVNLTYGLVKNLEVGIDIFEPSTDPFQFNAKYGLPETDQLPAMAVGAMNLGTKTDVTNYNILYVVAAKTFKPLPRLSLGYYSGNDKLFVDELGEKANTGLILSLDKQLTDNVWACIDYASGKSWYGETSFGFSYLFATNTSIIFGYVVYNNDKINKNNQVTTQLDINF
ncbi:MAG: hypothetical protein LHV68_09255 [Elusimicrobia bacterium]|nr:hypothetical protein [Candidatus Liberimonas magnetica]